MAYPSTQQLTHTGREATRIVMTALLTAGSFVVAQSWRELLTMQSNRAYARAFCRTPSQQQSIECKTSLQRRDMVPSPVLVFESVFTTCILVLFILSTRYTLGEYMLS